MSKGGEERGKESEKEDGSKPARHFLYKTLLSLRVPTHVKDLSAKILGQTINKARTDELRERASQKPPTTRSNYMIGTLTK